MTLAWFSDISTGMVAVLTCALFGCSNHSRPVISWPHRSVEIVAHRGASFVAPENTLAAIDLAWARDSDAVEVDVHLSHDGRIVAIHDRSTARTGGTRLEVAQTRSSILRRLDVGCHKGPQFAGQRIPFLEEILERIPPRRRLFVELKCGTEIIPSLCQLLTGHAKRSQVVVIGFDLDTMQACKTAMPDLSVYWLCDSVLLMPHGRDLIDKTLTRGLDGLDVHYAGVTHAFAAAVQAAGLDLYVWTVDNPRQAAILSAWGVDGITTNRPGQLRPRVGPIIAGKSSSSSDTASSHTTLYARSGRRLSKGY